jgi:ribosomal protein S18 acetylase RimI-like enzyme
MAIDRRAVKLAARMDEGAGVAGASDDLELRRAAAADVPAIRALVREAYEKYVARIGREPAPMTADYDAAVRGHQVWLLDEGQGLRAVLELVPAGDGSVLIENIAVAPRTQGSGVGRRLMDFAEREALRQGFGCVTLYTNEKMVENIALYARLGYVETERRTVDNHRRVFMRKDLART